jgi:glycosyltransferase involved in cell wall biosynthesis
MSYLLSVIIPSHNDIYLHRTIDSLLDNAQGEIEIIPVLDGYEPATSFRSDPRIRPRRHAMNLGMREAINTGVAAARGEYLMRTDEHCMFGERFDAIILDTIQPDWIVVPRRYCLDPVAWTVMDVPPVDYEQLKVVHYERGRKFSGVPWKQRTDERKDIPIDETMAMQGSCWFMTRTWWERVIVRLESEGYGTHYQDSHEMVFKTWKAGGKLMINKLTWYAHKHRSYPRTHGYGGEPADRSFRHALDVWGDYYLEIRQAWGL